MRRSIGSLLLCAGMVLLGAVGYRYVQGSLARDRARAVWEEVEARETVLAARRSVADLDRGPWAPGSPVARVIIPRIGLDEVILAGVEATTLNAAPGHMPGTPLPGGLGNSVISAHRDRHFRTIGGVGIGDTVTTVTRAGKVHWRITERRIVGEREPALFQTSTPTLTLTTCWPIRLIGPAPDRLLLTAVPLDGSYAGGASPRRG